MSARKIMIEAWALRQGVSHGIAAVEVDALLGIVDIAGYAVVPKSLLAKLPSDPPMSGLPKVDLAKVDFTAAKETP